MAKKSVWRDNTEPPTNYIWVRLDDMGNVIGVYEHNGSVWTPVVSATSVAPGSTSGAAESLLVDLENGEEPQKVKGSVSASTEEHTIAVRTEDGRLKASEAIESDDVVTLSFLQWTQA